MVTYQPSTMSIRSVADSGGEMAITACEMEDHMKRGEDVDIIDAERSAKA